MGYEYGIEVRFHRRTHTLRSTEGIENVQTSYFLGQCSVSASSIKMYVAQYRAQVKLRVVGIQYIRGPSFLAFRSCTCLVTKLDRLTVTDKSAMAHK